MNKRVLSIIIAAAIVLISGCATSISSIKTEPAYYVGKDVTVSGEVTLEAAIPFMDYTIFQIDDGSGRMFIMSSEIFHIGDRLQSRAKDIGITEKGSATAAAEIKKDTADFLVKHGIAEQSAANKLSKKLFLLIAAFGEKAEGSYFLMAE